MPFTLAHPAAVLPLRRWLWFPGLVAGAVAPDVGYYLPVLPRLLLPSLMASAPGRVD